MSQEETNNDISVGKQLDTLGGAKGETDDVVVPDNEFELDPEKRREARKLRRIMANRKSARESRERRKRLLTDLQDSVATLTTDNAKLTQENLTLRRELATLIKQAGGPAALNTIPNIQSILESAQVFSNLPNLSDPTSSTLIASPKKKKV